MTIRNPLTHLTAYYHIKYQYEILWVIHQMQIVQKMIFKLFLLILKHLIATLWIMWVIL